MVAEQLINHLIPPLKPEDTAGRALDWMDEFRCNQLPVVSDGHLLGFISSDILIDGNDRHLPISSLELSGQDCTVNSEAHFYEVLRIAADHDMQMVAVVDDDRYVGVITTGDVLTMFAQTTAVRMPGSVLVLSMESVQYSLAEIARLVEENKARILNASLAEDPLDAARIRVVLKIDQPDLSRIVATLERFDYKVVGRYQQVQSDTSDRERFDLLMRYLNI